DGVSVWYPGSPDPVLRGVDLHMPEGEFVLVSGPTGVGKSTLLGTMNGLVPHFTGGTLAGRVQVGGLDTRTHPPRELAHVVGVVGQDPQAGFVTDTVEEELAYGMEQLGVPPGVMRTRVEETLDLLSIAPLRNRALRTLSGGQQQRVAIGSVLAAGARALVLDEPTSALDPTSAEEVLAALLRLVHDIGVTVVVAEHRLERVAEYADRMVVLRPGGEVVGGTPTEMMATSPIVPPVVELGRLMGWQPLPLSVRDARRCAPPLRASLAGLDAQRFDRLPAAPGHSDLQTAEATAEDLVASGMTVVFGRTVAVRDVDLTLSAGQICVLMGRNGSGKSSLLWALTGVGPRQSGRWSVGGQELGKAEPATVRDKIRLVPQTASDLLYLESVGAECAMADRTSGRPAGTCRALLDTLAPGIPDGSHPRDLSEGQKLSLVLAAQLCSQPPVILLDEPTRGLDYPAKRALALTLTALARAGRAICVATHDAEFAATVADRVLVMATGELIADGPAHEVLTASSALAPQVSKVLTPEKWLTVAQVQRALDGGR
ncbi:MAG TPA: ATP-binding cassette domain-containing protein, partial [Actinomycetota bacterium]|nr:ATP-binding cassette domain-containing protein [Actinomycetota bacterium]